MTFITFIYRIENDPKIYYGKHCTKYVSDHHEGLDLEIKYDLIRYLNEYRGQNNILKVEEKTVSVGVLTFSSNRNIPVYSSDDEKKCFDYYYEYYDNVIKVYFSGKLLEKNIKN